MVTRDIEVVESDLSGESGAETTLFGLKGQAFELDLTTDERADLEAILAPYIAKARVLGPLTVKPPTRRRVPELTPGERATVRSWARTRGYEISDHGQIPNVVVSAFRAAQPTPRPPAGNAKPSELQAQLARAEAEVVLLRRRLSHNQSGEAG